MIAANGAAHEYGCEHFDIDRVLSCKPNTSLVPCCSALKGTLQAAIICPPRCDYYLVYCGERCREGAGLLAPHLPFPVPSFHPSYHHTDPAHAAGISLRRQVLSPSRPALTTPLPLSPRPPTQTIHHMLRMRPITPQGLSVGACALYMSTSHQSYLQCPHNHAPHPLRLQPPMSRV